jgi:hypothetical protein
MFHSQMKVVAGQQATFKALIRINSLIASYSAHSFIFRRIAGLISTSKHAN